MRRALEGVETKCKNTYKSALFYAYRKPWVGPSQSQVVFNLPYLFYLDAQGIDIFQKGGIKFSHLVKVLLGDLSWSDMV